MVALKLRDSWQRKPRRLVKNEVSLEIDDTMLIDYLEELAERLGIEIRHKIITPDEEPAYTERGV